ncbi:MAG: hypothetical protein JWQ97_2743 [Phenylobacterium sp.]|nr:hypothetical protein [Phenylobacterium sp.]
MQELNVPIYSLYPTRADGSSLSFSMVEFTSDDQALRQARKLCAEHGSCDHVVVWEEDRLVGSIDKPTPASEPPQEAGRTAA